MNMISTGIGSLDSSIEGGFPNGSNILIFGPPGTCKSIFCQQFTKSCLDRKIPVVYVCSSECPSNVLAKMQKFGWNVKAKLNRGLVFVDFYSWRLGKKKVPETKFVLQDPNDLKEVKAKVLGALGTFKKREKELCVVFDSVSSLLMYCSEPERLLACVAGLAARVRESCSLGLFVLEEGVQDQTTVAFVDTMMDSAVQFSVVDNERLLRVSRMSSTNHGRDWYEFKVTQGGLTLAQKRYMPEEEISEYIR